MTNPSGYTVTSYDPDNLIAGDYPRVTQGITIGGAATLAKGTLVQADGSEVGAGGTLFGVLAEDVDASGGDVESVVYLSGEFNENKLTTGSAGTVASYKTAARDLNIYFKSATVA